MDSLRKGTYFPERRPGEVIAFEDRGHPFTIQSRKPGMDWRNHQEAISKKNLHGCMGMALMVHPKRAFRIVLVRGARVDLYGKCEFWPDGFEEADKEAKRA